MLLVSKASPHPPHPAGAAPRRRLPPPSAGTHPRPPLPPHPYAGPGQFEVATAPAEALAAADALLFSREGVAAVAAKHGLVASFLPKLLPGAAGSGQHLHFSIWDEQVPACLPECEHACVHVCVRVRACVACPGCLAAVQALGRGAGQGPPPRLQRTSPALRQHTAGGQDPPTPGLALHPTLPSAPLPQPGPVVP